MSRMHERILLMVGCVWNLFTGLLTIFSYNTWFKQNGKAKLQALDIDEQFVGSHLMDNVSHVIMVFGLFMFVAAIVNFLIFKSIKDNTIQKKMLAWIGIWAVIQLVSMDVIGFVIFMVAFVLYIAKNKAIKLANEDSGHNPQYS